MTSTLKITTLALALTSAPLMAADITVAPGTTTLQTAISTAAEGDTLLLTSGTYALGDTSSLFLVTKSLTIKAASAAVEPIIANKISVPGGTALDHLIIQGLTFSSVSVSGISISSIDGHVENLQVLENTFYASESLHIDTPFNSSETATATVIGNRFLCSSNASASVNVESSSVNFMGNSVCHKSGSLFTLSALNQSTGLLNVIGNQISLYSVSNSAWPIRLIGAGIQFTGNHINSLFTLPGTTVSLNSTFSYGLIREATSSNAALGTNISNNVFNIDGTRTTGSLSRYSIISELDNVSFDNNVVSVSNLLVEQPAVAGIDEQAPMFADYTTSTVPASFSGNIITGYDDEIFTDVVEASAKNNLCFNNRKNCGTANGNISSDPLFVDSANGDFSLQISSPAVDAGPADLTLYDAADGTRNDMGAYSGSWSIDTFQAQLAVDATGPYLYPLQDAHSTVANGELSVKFVTYPRLK